MPKHGIDFHARPSSPFHHQILVVNYALTLAGIENGHRVRAERRAGETNEQRRKRDEDAGGDTHSSR